MSIVLAGSSSGSVTIQEPAVAGTSVLTLPVGTGTVVVNNVNSAIVSSTSVASTSGTSIDFTGIPSWAKKITVLCNGISTNGSSQVVVQLGDAGGIETSGYIGSITRASTVNDFSSSFIVHSNIAAATIAYVYVTITNVTGNTWMESSIAASAGNVVAAGAGGKTLSDTLTQVRITTVNGTDTFDAGSINILYE